jgi:hypothetical protein
LICIFTGAKVMILSRKFLKFEIDIDFVLIAVTTSLKDYRICHLINKYLNLNFIKISDLTVDAAPGTSTVLCSRYQHKTDTIHYYFIANKGIDGYLIPEMRKADYFLMVKNFITEPDVDSLVSALNKISEIIAAVKIDAKKIKSRENLLF